MTAPIVAIEISAADIAPPTLEALLDACTRALSQGSCVSAASMDATEQSAATAIVILDGPEHRRVRIELAKRGAARDAWLRREIVFRPEDAELERWRAVGLVIATLAGDAGADPGREPTPPAPPPEPRVVVAPPRERPSRTPPAHRTDQPWVWIDASGLVSPALDDGSWRAGLQLRGGVPLRALPLFGLVSLRYAVRPADDAGLAVQFASGSVGAGLHLTPARRISLQARIELLAEIVAASVTDPATAASDSGSRWVGGARLGADGAWMAHPNLGIIAGIDATLLQSATSIRLGGRTAAEAPPLSVAPSLGIRVSLP